MYPASWGNFSFEGTASAAKSDDAAAGVVMAWRSARFDISTTYNVTYAQGLNCNGVGVSNTDGPHRNLVSRDERLVVVAVQRTELHPQ